MFEESKRKHQAAVKKLRKLGLTKEVLSEKFKSLSNRLTK